MNFFQRIKLRRQVKQHINRPLDIREIISRESDTNVVVDAYEFFMRKYHWEIDECDSPYVRIFLLCVRYDGEIANGGISQFLANTSCNYAHQTADALHTIGALDAETLLRKSFLLFSDGIVLRFGKLDFAEGSAPQTTPSFRTSAHTGVGISIEFQTAYRHTVSSSLPFSGVYPREVVLLFGRLPRQCALLYRNDTF